MIVRPLVLRGRSRYAFRRGEMADVIGLMNVMPDPMAPVRPCLLCVYPDGHIDYVPLSSLEDGTYELVEKP